ncbi:MAG: TonB-dependent receptor [Pseudomonadota bacterium]
MKIMSKTGPFISLPLVFALAPSASAQMLEEIVVTAQKREQSIQDVGIAITAFSGSQISDLGWTNAEQVAAQTPGLVATSYNNAGTISLFSIRGVAQTDFNDHQEAPTVVYMDEAYIPATSAAGAAIFDMERIEVLKGPQGTLYGRNATGGLVHLITAKPTEEFEAFAELEYSENDTTRVEAAVSGPLSDTLLGRLAVMHKSGDAYFDNRIGPDLRELDTTHVRGHLQFNPSDQLSALLSLGWGEFDNPAAGYVHRTAVLNEDGLGEYGPPGSVDFGEYADTDGDFYSGDLGSPGPNDAEGWNATFNLTYDLANGMRFISVTNAQNNEKDYQEDSDSSPADFGDFLTQQDADSFSQEFRLEGSSDDLNWVAGLYYLQIDGDYRVSFNFPDYFGYSIFPNNLYSLETESWAIFSQLEYNLGDSFKLIAGLRWTEDEKDFDTNATCEDRTELNGCSDFGLVQGPVQPLPTVADLSPLSLDRSDEDYTGKLQLEWTPGDDLLLYAGVSRGMKAGGFLGSIDGGATLDELSFEPEILTSYEIGFKSTLADGMARLNGSLFYYDYSDYQAFVFQGITSVISNQDAEVTGGELELIANPGEGWDVMLGVSALDTTVEDVDIGGGVIRDQSMVLAPDLSINLLIRKHWETDIGGIWGQIDGLYTDEQQFNTINSEAAANEDYSVWNARIGYAPSENWLFEAFVNNLADEEYWTYGFDLALFFGSAIQAFGEPRWYGARVRYTF